MRHYLLRSVLIVVAVAAVARLSWAQWGGYSSATTAGESAARGLADVVRSEGQRNVMNAEAAKQYEQARSQYIQNQLQYTDQYYAAKKIKQENYHAEEARKNKTPSPEAVYRAALASAPKRLTEKELDPTTGKIFWPKVLSLPSYKVNREELDASFAERAVVGELDGEQYLHVQQTVQHLLAELKKHIRDYPPQDYTTARGFGDRLVNEARFAVIAPAKTEPKPPPPKP